MPDSFIENIWYATRERAESISKTIVYDDKGKLLLSEEAIAFEGNKLKLRVERRKIRNMSLVTQKLPIKSYAVSALASLVFWVPLLAIVLFISVILAFVLKNLFVIVGCMGAAILMFPLSILAGMAVGLSMKWVKIDYLDDKGKEESAYFFDGSKLGWGGIFGGTKRLYGAISKKG